MKKLLIFLLPFLLFSCGGDDNQNNSVVVQLIDINLEFNLGKHILIQTNQEIETKISWTPTDNTPYAYTYQLFEIDSGGAITPVTAPTVNGSEATLQLEPSKTYTFRVNGFLNNVLVGKSEYVFSTPSLVDFGAMVVDITVDYHGWTAFNFLLDGLNAGFENEIYFNNVSEPEELIENNFYESDLLVRDLPVNWISDDISIPDFYKLKIIVCNSQIGVESSIEIDTKLLYRLPDDDWYAVVHYVDVTKAYCSAANYSTIQVYDPNNSGPKTFSIFLDGEFIRTNHCDHWGNGIDNQFPVFENLEPGSTHIAKIVVGPPVGPYNLEYEDEQVVRNVREIEFTTYQTPLTDDIMVEIENLSDSGFDLIWRTDLRLRYSCYPGYMWNLGFDLKVNGVSYASFGPDDNPVAITGLSPNTEYNMELVFTYIQNSTNYEKQVGFTVTTLP